MPTHRRRIEDLESQLDALAADAAAHGLPLAVWRAGTAAVRAAVEAGRSLTLDEEDAVALAAMVEAGADADAVRAWQAESRPRRLNVTAIHDVARSEGLTLAQAADRLRTGRRPGETDDAPADDAPNSPPPPPA